MNKITFLDGINNLGMSGGPVITWSYDSKEPKIYDVISGYYPQKNKMDFLLSKKKGIASYIENSGIIFCYPLTDVENIITQIP